MFAFPTVALRVLNWQKPHSINGDTVKVTLKRTVKKTKNNRVLYVLNKNKDTTKDGIRFFLRNLSGTKIIKVDFGAKNDALVTFSSDVGKSEPSKAVGRREAQISKTILSVKSGLHIRKLHQCFIVLFRLKIFFLV